jgi:asparagine synthase (glutamine-hydrolysing)
MIVSGFFWRNGSRRSEDIAHLKSISKNMMKIEYDLIDTPHLTLFKGKSGLNDQDIMLNHDNSILIGRVFDKKHSEPVHQGILRSLDKEKLVSDYWGKYLYFSHSGEASSISIVRDPTGQLPLFYCTHPNGAVLFSSELSIINDFLPERPSINWSYMASHLLHGIQNSTQTAFEDIYELPPGYVLTCKNGSVEIDVAWNPSDYIQPKPINNDSLIDVLEKSLRSWHHTYDTLHVSYSGGLDSTALLYGIDRTKSNKQRINAINFHHPEVKSSNELPYAQAVCDDLGIELTKLNMAENLPFSPTRKPILLKPNKPFPALTHLKMIEAINGIVNETPSSLFISGQGGDHIFMAPPPKTLFVDYIKDKGLRGSKTQLDALTKYYRTTYYQILKCNILKLFQQKVRRKSLLPYQNKATWFTRELCTLGKQPFSHPILKQLPTQLLPGKLEHITAIDNAFASISVEMKDHNPTCTPLLYQPVVEHALSMPTYKLLDQGYDRYPFRDAISKAYKTNHVWRRSKGETSGILQLGMRANMKYLRELCLEGHFARHGLIHKKTLEAHLNRVASGEVIDIWSLMYIISSELFFSFYE